MMGDKNLRVPGTPGTTMGSQAARSETRRDYDWRQDLTSSRGPRHHHPVPKLQEGRQEEFMMGDDLAIFRDPPHHHPVPKLHKLQEERQEEMMMGDKTGRFPETPGTIMSSLAQI